MAKNNPVQEKSVTGVPWPWRPSAWLLARLSLRRQVLLLAVLVAVTMLLSEAPWRWPSTACWCCAGCWAGASSACSTG